MIISKQNTSVKCLAFVFVVETIDKNETLFIHFSCKFTHTHEWVSIDCIVGKVRGTLKI